MILFFFLFDAPYAVAHTGVDGCENNIVTSKEYGADGYFGAGASAWGGPEVGLAEQALKAAGISVKETCGQSGESGRVGAIGADPIGRVLQRWSSVITQLFVFLGRG